MSVGTQPAALSQVGVEDDGEAGAPYGTLVCLNPGLGLTVIELVNSEVSFGRGTMCDHSFPKNKEVSSRHCVLFVEPDSQGSVGRVLVRDLSTNGTYVNGEKIGKDQVAELRHGAELSLGVKSSALAKKSASNAQTFVAFIYKSSGSGEADVHEAFLEPNGPTRSYECSKGLGSGAFAEVRLCFHRKTGVKYAAKIVDKNKFALNKELRKGSFRDEVEILKSIRSPYIVRCEDIFETDNFLTMILQYVSGGDLFDKLSALKRYSEQDAKIVFYQMAQGLQYLHGRGIAHRDLKPENFLVLSDQSDVLVLIGDFGLARVFNGEASFMKTLCGTPQYLAPEVVQQARENKMQGYTQAVDIWSLGVILYILLVGYPPFGPKDFDDIVQAKFDFNHARWKSVSEAAKQLIRRMLVREPERRASIADVCGDPWLAGVVVPATPAGVELVQATSSQTGRIAGATVSPRKAKPVAAAEKDARVRFEEPEKERVPTEALVESGSGSRRKLRERKPTGIKKREREDKDDEEEEEEGKDEARPTAAELNKLRLAELRALCAERGLDGSGNKKDLINRLV